MHEGSTMSSGHYTALVCKETWILYDDEKVSVTDIDLASPSIAGVGYKKGMFLSFVIYLSLINFHDYWRDKCNWEGLQGINFWYEFLLFIHVREEGEIEQSYFYTCTSM